MVVFFVPWKVCLLSEFRPEGSRWEECFNVALRDQVAGEFAQRIESGERRFDDGSEAAVRASSKDS